MIVLNYAHQKNDGDEVYLHLSSLLKVVTLIEANIVF